jgi:Zn-dependent protease
LDLSAPKILDLAITLAVLLFAVSFHESAHALSAFLLGDTTARDMGRISLNPIRHIDPFGSILLPILLYMTSGLLFGYAKPTPVDLRNTRNPRLADFVVSAAGPGSNFLLAALAVVVLLLIKQVGPGSRYEETIVAPLLHVTLVFLQVNLSLAIFNLIPIPPLDGSGVLASVLGGGARRAFNSIAPFGFLILILLSSTGFLGRIMGPVFAGVNLLLRRLLS